MTRFELEISDVGSDRCATMNSQVMSRWWAFIISREHLSSMGRYATIETVCTQDRYDD